MRPAHRPERCWARRCSSTSLSRSCCTSGPIEAPRSDGATRTPWVSTARAERLTRVIRTWQAVVAVGVDSHLWRLEALQRRPLPVRAQPRTATLRAALHRPCPAECRCEAAGLTAHEANSRLTCARLADAQGCASTVIATTIGAEVAGASVAAYRLVLDVRCSLAVRAVAAAQKVACSARPLRALCMALWPYGMCPGTAQRTSTRHVCGMV